MEGTVFKMSLMQGNIHWEQGSTGDGAVTAFPHFF